MRKRTLLLLAFAGVFAAALALPALADAHHYRYGYGYYNYGYYYGYPYYGGYGPYQGGRFVQDGSLRIEVGPKEDREEIDVYVDGALAGVVNDYDGTFQRLRLSPGKHEIELRLDGYETYRMTVFVERGRTFHIRGELVPLRAM